MNRHPCAPLPCWTCSCSVAGNVHALLLGMFMLFSRQLCPWSSILPSRFLWHDPTGAFLCIVPAHGVSRNWCGDLAKNGVTAKRSERLRTCRQIGTSFGVTIMMKVWLIQTNLWSQKLEEKSTLKVTCRVGAVVVKHDEKQSLTPVMQPDDDI